MRPRSCLHAALALIAVALATQANATSIKIVETPDWYGGLGLEIAVPDMPDARFVLWPQEAWSVASPSVDNWEFIRLEHLDGLDVSEDGSVHYKTQGLIHPGVHFEVSVIPRDNHVDLEVTVQNTSKESVYATSGPCLQMPEQHFGGEPANRAGRVFVVNSDNVLTWTSDTRRVAGSKPQAPWSQLYLTVDNPRKTVKHGFGLSPDRVASGVVGAVSEDRRLAVAFVTDRPSGVAYAFLNCIHAALGVTLPPGANISSHSRIYFETGGTQRLLQRIAKDYPEVLPDDAQLKYSAMSE